jgi:hypothetical protein
MGRRISQMDADKSKRNSNLKTNSIHSHLNSSKSRHSRESGNPEKTGFRVKPGMTNAMKFMSSCLKNASDGFSDFGFFY